MNINPFWQGVVVTLAVEFLLIIIVGINETIKNNKNGGNKNG